MEKLFDIEQIEDLKRVKMAYIELKGHASLWWDNMKLEKERKGKDKIKKWDKIISKFKGKFLPIDYTLNLYRKLQNLKQKDIIVKEYT
jgi:hypothetical protein